MMCVFFLLYVTKFLSLIVRYIVNKSINQSTTEPPMLTDAFLASFCSVR